MKNVLLIVFSALMKYFPVTVEVHQSSGLTRNIFISKIYMATKSIMMFGITPQMLSVLHKYTASKLRKEGKTTTNSGQDYSLTRYLYIFNSNPQTLNTHTNICFVV